MIKEKLKENLDNFYSQEQCFALYQKYLKNWIADGYIGVNLNIFELSMVSEKTAKDFFLELIFEIFSDGNTFKKIFEILNGDVQFLFERLIWLREYKLNPEDEEKFLIKNNDRDYKLKEEFQFFKLKSITTNEIELYFDYELARNLRPYMKKPKEYYLNDATAEMEANKKLYRDDNEKEFLNNMSLYLDFYKSGLIKISESGKVLKDTKKDMLKHCSITEYYGDLKGLEYVKTEIISIFFTLLSDDYTTEKYFNTTNIKNVLKDFIETKSISKDLHFPYTFLFLNYLKGVKNIWENSEDLKSATTNLISLIKEMNENDCLDVKNIIRAYIFRNENKNMDLIALKDVKDYIYINEANYERTKILTCEDYEELIIEPFIKSYLFLLGTLGVFELFYTKPENNAKLYLKSGYLSQFGGLKYIKLTDLGKYLFGFKESYTVPTNYEKSELFLDDKRLIVTILGESPTKRMFFEKISKKIGNNIYKITIDSFKRTVKYYDELIERIENFKKNIGTQELAPNWNEFFETLIKKFNSLEEINEFIVLKLKDDKELLQIIIKDTRFKNLFLKAEDYHLLVKKDDVEELSKILKEYGYHLNYNDKI